MKKVIVVNNLKQLKEMSSCGGGNLTGYAGAKRQPPFGNKKDIEEYNKKQETEQRLQEEEDEMREDIIVERKIREYIRAKVKKVILEKKETKRQEERALRNVIRQLLKEGDISDIHPHRSTGINILEDLLKKMVPTLRTDYKRMTSDSNQRESFRAHMIKAVKDSLMPSLINDKFKQPPGPGGPLLSVPDWEPGEEEKPPEEIEDLETAEPEEDEELDLEDEELEALQEV